MKDRRERSGGERRHRPRKRFGQHFLQAQWAEKVVKAIAPAPGDVFLEIGPGPGALTFPLARSGAPILAVEIDRDLVADLARRVPPNVTVVSGDVLQTDVIPFLTGLASFSRVILWDRDFQNNVLAEQELAFFAQDHQGPNSSMGV